MNAVFVPICWNVFGGQIADSDELHRAKTVKGGVWIANETTISLVGGAIAFFAYFAFRPFTDYLEPAKAFKDSQRDNSNLAAELQCEFDVINRVSA